MHFKECYVSKNGISCITSINTLHKMNNIISKSSIKNNILTYLSIRTIEFIIIDFLKNYKEVDNNDNYFIQLISFS